MHPPAFDPNQSLSDWPDCFLELRCPGCGSIVIAPLRLLIRRRGNQPIGALLKGLRCKRCGREPAPVYLCAGHHRRAGGGIAASWAIELVSALKAT